jgi:hypothetical protein
MTFIIVHHRTGEGGVRTLKEAPATATYDEVASFTFQPERTDGNSICEAVWSALNSYPMPPDAPADAHGDPDMIGPWHRLYKVVVKYRAERNRSLSVGDIVQVDGVMYEAQNMGSAQLVERDTPDEVTVEWASIDHLMNSLTPKNDLKTPSLQRTAHLRHDPGTGEDGEPETPSDHSVPVAEMDMGSRRPGSALGSPTRAARRCASRGARSRRRRTATVPSAPGRTGP